MQVTFSQRRRRRGGGGGGGGEEEVQSSKLPVPPTRDGSKSQVFEIMKGGEGGGDRARRSQRSSGGGGRRRFRRGQALLPAFQGGRRSRDYPSMGGRLKGGQQAPPGLILLLPLQQEEGIFLCLDCCPFLFTSLPTLLRPCFFFILQEAPEVIPSMQRTAI